MTKKIVAFLLIVGVVFSGCLTVQAENQQKQKSELTIVVPENSKNEGSVNSSKEKPASQLPKTKNSNQKLLSTNDKPSVYFTMLGCLCLAIAVSLYFKKRKDKRMN